MDNAIYKRNALLGTKTRIALWGASGHALVVTDILQLCREFEIIGYLDDANPERKNETFSEARVLGGKEQLSYLKEKGINHIIVAIGDCRARLKISATVQQAGFARITAIHPSSIVARSAVVGAGTVVAAGAVINPATKIGDDVIINTCASIDHECIINDGVHIGPGTHTGGLVRIDRCTFVGAGVTIRDRVHIGRNCVIGAGSVVVQDIPDDVVAYGVPARVVRTNGNNQFRE